MDKYQKIGLGFCFLLFIIIIIIIYAMRHSDGFEETSPIRYKLGESQNDGIQIENQPSGSMQIVNNTSEKFLHLFIEYSKNQKHRKKLGGSPNSKMYEAIDWRDRSWDPLGAKILAEVIIPKNEYIIFEMSKELGSTNIAALKMKDYNSDKPLTYEDGKDRCKATLCKLYEQVPILFEGGPDAVADISGVDGINFKIRYSLTTKNNIKSMES